MVEHRGIFHPSQCVAPVARAQTACCLGLKSPLSWGNFCIQVILFVKLKIVTPCSTGFGLLAGPWWDSETARQPIYITIFCISDLSFALLITNGQLLMLITSDHASIYLTMYPYALTTNQLATIVFTYQKSLKAGNYTCNYTVWLLQLTFNVTMCIAIKQVAMQ